MAESKTKQLLEYTLEGHFTKAKALCSEATEELETHGSQFTGSQKQIIEHVRKIIKNLIENQTIAAQKAAESTNLVFSQDIIGPLLRSIQKTGGILRQKPIAKGNAQLMHETTDHNKYDTTKLSDGARGAAGEYNQSRTYQTDSRDEYSKHQASKRASHALRLNNPDIADLSDTNRPTKIAEKFSELYDNEWTEAFEKLSITERNSEKGIIGTLLTIVEDAYKFCRAEADRQIDNLQSNCIEIFKGEQVSPSRKFADPPHDKGREYLVEYRKGIAESSLQYLTEKFKSHMKIKYSDERIIAYVDKAVELTWWMAVQDPPVYMCPTTTHFDSNLYKPYTRSGKIPDFFVWPALKLYKDGGLLMKGVVQYKN